MTQGGESSTQSFVPRPNDWGQMRVEGKDDDNIVLTGEGGRRLEIDDTGGRRPVVLYEAPGTNGYIAEGNLRDPTRRAQWAREIAGPSLDLQNGVKAESQGRRQRFYGGRPPEPRPAAPGKNLSAGPAPSQAGDQVDLGKNLTIPSKGAPKW